MAMEKSARGQPNSVAMGSWNSPKLARMPNPISKIMDAAIRTGVKTGDLVNYTLRPWEADVATGFAIGQIKYGDIRYVFLERVGSA